MWVKKSEWEDMKKQVDAFRKIHEYDNKAILENGLVLYLPKCAQYYFDHREIEKPITEMMFQIINDKLTHIPTDTIPDLTLEELSRYVIDGKPIRRKEEIDVEYRSE